QVDPQTGYRYYSLDQAPVAERIRLLRDLEVPLAQIQALAAETDPERVRQSLEHHRQELAERLAETQEHLWQLEALIEELKGGIAMEFTLRDLPPVPVLAQRTVLTDEERPTAGRLAFQALYGALEGRWDELLGPPFALHHGNDREDATEIDWCVPFADAPTIDGVGAPRTVPGARYAVAVHLGPSQAMGQTYRALYRWMLSRGLEPGGPVREVYIKNPGNTPNPQEHRTELCWPVG
ncbi:MAG TPA: MerR family transcriptional regulator, partial [bacterium]|nr:MerR family transcriptional regulator [bacterium]